MQNKFCLVQVIKQVPNKYFTCQIFLCPDRFWFCFGGQKKSSTCLGLIYFSVSLDGVIHLLQGQQVKGRDELNCLDRVLQKWLSWDPALYNYTFTFLRNIVNDTQNYIYKQSSISNWQVQNNIAGKVIIHLISKSQYCYLWETSIHKARIITTSKWSARRKNVSICKM